MGVVLTRYDNSALFKRREMAANMGFHKDNILYCLLVGANFINQVTKEHQKRWSIHFHHSERGRRQGMIYQARQYPGSDLLTLELKLEDLIKIAKLKTIIPKELPVDYDIRRFLRSKDKE